MALATCLQYVRVDSTTVVAHHYSKVLAGVLYFYFYSIRLSMQKCIYECLAADTVQVVADGGPQRAPVAVSDDAVTDFLVDSQFLPQARECQFEVAAVAVRGSQTTEGVSTFLCDPPHQLQYAS